MDLFYVLSNLALVASAIYLFIILRKVSKRIDETIKTYFDFCLVFIFLIPIVAGFMGVVGNRSQVMQLMEPLANFSLSVGTLFLALGIRHLFRLLIGSKENSAPENA